MQYLQEFSVLIYYGKVCNFMNFLKCVDLFFIFAYNISVDRDVYKTGLHTEQLKVSVEMLLRKLNSDSVIENITSSMGIKPYANVLVVLSINKTNCRW